MAQAQDTMSETNRSKRAWEVGIGGSLVNWHRASLTNFQATPAGYTYTVNGNQAFGGVNLYVARELCSWLYADLQGTVGFPAKIAELDNNSQKIMLMGGLGLQFRFTPLIKSKYVEPYLRAGINYLHKDFQTVYEGKMPTDATGQAFWNATDPWNPNRRKSDSNGFIPVSLGAGVNFWLSNSLGLGLQGEYLLPIKKDLPHFAMATARVMWRIGGAAKQQQLVNYVRIEKPVETIVEKVVEKEVIKTKTEKLYDVINNINFDFDSHAVTAESHTYLDEAARILKMLGSDYNFLVTGYTDARGSDNYNMNLSRRRAQTVVDELTKRGVSAAMLKSRGVGKRITAMPAS